ncbi:MAG: hypothetical protein QXK08_04035 [Candidatus Woesearchaeota archaeon]
MHDEESGWMKWLKIGIVGIGKPSSLGFALSYTLVHSTTNCYENGKYINVPIMDYISLLLLNSKTPECVKMHMAGNLIQPLDEKVKGIYEQKIKLAKKSQLELKPGEKELTIAENADMTVFCYECGGFGASGYGFPIWEGDVRDKLYVANKDATIEMAKLFKGTKSQCLFVTNPCLDIARLFQDTANLTDGQVVAYNPDSYRLIEALLLHIADNPNVHDLKQSAFLLGDHAKDLCKAFYRRELDNDVDVVGVVEDVKLEGLLLASLLGTTSYNIAKNIAEFLISPIKQDYEPPFVLGVPFYLNGKKIFMSVPVINKLKEENGIMVCRTEICKDAIKDYVNTPEFAELFDKIYLKQKNTREGTHDVDYGHGIISFSGTESSSMCNCIQLCNYRGLGDHHKKKGQKGNGIIDCGSAIERIATSGRYFAAVTVGKNEGKKMVPELIHMTFSPNSTSSDIKPESTRLEDYVGRRFMALALDKNRAYLESHLRGEDISQQKPAITIFENGHEIKREYVDFVPLAFGFSGNKLYCADEYASLRILDKNTLKEIDSQNTIPAPKGIEEGMFINSLFVIPGKNEDIVCGMTVVPEDRPDSKVFVWKGKQLIHQLEVPNQAFYAARAGDRNIMFYGARKDGQTVLRLQEIEQTEPCQEVEIGSEIVSIALDSKNHLYVGSPDSATVIPYMPLRLPPWSQMLMDDRDHKRQYSLKQGCLEKICPVIL